jgi:hypothetical protein
VFVCTGTQQPTKSCNGGGGDNAAMVLRCLTMFLRRNPYRKKKRQKKSIFIYGTTFKKKEFFREFSARPDLEDRSQKQKKNYGSHPVGLVKK